jgi:hypothetical protein
MGRPKRYRERIRFEMHSVAAKDVRAVMERTLRAEFGRSRIEAEVLASRSLDWLEGLGAGTVPGQVRLGVPAGRSRRYAPHNRRVVTVTAVDVGEDTKVWEEFGLAAMQRRRSYGGSVRYTGRVVGVRRERWRVLAGVSPAEAIGGTAS